MDYDSTSIVPFRGGAMEHAAWGRLHDMAANASARIAVGPQRSKYHARLELELELFGELGIAPGVLLELSWVVRDLRSRGVVFGLGYGAQCGSLLLYLLGLHGVDPLSYDIPFTGFGSELERQRLHLRVPSRAEQAETTAMLRHYARISLADEVDEKAVYVVVGRAPASGFTAAMNRMMSSLQGQSSLDSMPPQALNDDKTLRLINQGNVAGIHLLDDQRLLDCMHQHQPQDMETLLQLVAVSLRQESVHLKDRYLAACNEQQRPALPHPELDGILAPTANTWIFYEQIVAAFARLTGWEWNQTVRFCKHLRAEREEPGEGDYSTQAADGIGRACDLPQSRAIYLVRLLRQAMSHTVDRGTLLADVLEGYRQAYIKARYPSVFHAAQLNAIVERLSSHEGVRYAQPKGVPVSSEQRTALVELCSIAKHQGVEILPPDINQSEWGFKAVDRDRILFGLGAIACIDRGAARRIVAGRQENRYASLMDLLTKAYDGELDYFRIEPLILAGALDGLRQPRSAICRELAEMSGVAPPGLHDASQQQLGGQRSQRSAGDCSLWEGQRSEESWAFQRELDVLGCAPSSGYFPQRGSSPRLLRALS